MKRSFEPLVSIIIPVYNGSNFLGEAIESALRQTYKKIEVIVVNDGSTDHGLTAKIAEKYLDKIIYLEKANGGVATALNFGIQYMKGGFFSWLSHDDLYLPNKIADQVRCLAALPAPARSIIYGDYAFFENDPSQAVSINLGSRYPDEFRLYITRENTLHGCTLLIPRNALVREGGFNPTLLTTQDYDLWFRMAKRYKFFHLSSIGVLSRRHVAQGSNRFRHSVNKECDDLLCSFVRNLTEKELLALPVESVVEAYRSLAENFAQRGFSGAADVALHLSNEKLIEAQTPRSFWSSNRKMVRELFSSLLWRIRKQGGSKC